MTTKGLCIFGITAQTVLTIAFILVAQALPTKAITQAVWVATVMALWGIVVIVLINVAKRND